MKENLQKILYRLRIKIDKIRRQLTATQLVVISFLGLITIGAALLTMPISRQNPQIRPQYIDCVFTAVSASCVNGLTTVPTAFYWSTFGQVVVLLMMQIGGLSFVTLFSFFALNMGKKIDMKKRMTIQASLNQSSEQGIISILKLAIKGTFFVEGIGAVLLFLFFLINQHFSPLKAFYFSIFQSVASFCNAGFDVLGDTSLKEYVDNPSINLIIMALVIIGGLGFTVWQDLHKLFNAVFKKHYKNRIVLSLNTKLVLISTATLIILGFIYFFITEYKNPATLGELSLPGKIWASLFQSVTLRSAGYYTIDQYTLSQPSKFFSCILMMIGGSPGGTAGGIKTVTFAVVVSSIWSTIKGRQEIDIMKRNIPMHLFQKAITVIGIMMSLWFIIATALVLTELKTPATFNFNDFLFESASALSSTGIPNGVTPYLSNGGKMLIMICMFIGRLGPISIVLALHRRSSMGDNGIHYPQENVLIG